MYTVEYSILKYKTDMLLEEEINVAVAFNLKFEEGDFKEFYLLENRNRLYTFNDELNKEITNIYLESIKNEWLSSENNLLEKNKSFKDFTSRYVNNFKFNKILKNTFLNENDALDFVKTTWKHYLHYSLTKTKRLSNRKRSDYVGNVLKNSFKDSVIVDKQFKSAFGDIKTDFQISLNDENIIIKYLNEKTAIRDLRSYSFIAEHTGNKMFFIVNDKSNSTLNNIINVRGNNNIQLIKEDEIDNLVKQLS